MVMGARWWVCWLVVVAAAVARELDPAACASRFDVQRDKIIRTEESRDMGARYLSELDVGARHECLRLCCETDSCDVFVYEEKGPGSCYLFNCGPPEDFRCKFTAHSNFSSGVLALSRHLAELQDQERLAHHEQELANLRSVTSTTVSTTPATTVAPRPPAPAPIAPAAPLAPLAVPNAPLADPPPAPHPIPTSRCSRYQFECRRGGECIAVYNACDGVAQCADGSDEAPELGCPAAAPVPASPAPPPPPPPTPRPRVEPLVVPPRPVPETVLNSVPDPERWPHRLTQAQPQHRYTDPGASSHIFSHKGGLLQEADAGALNALNAQYPPFEPWPRRVWGQPQNGGESLGSERGWGGYGLGRAEWGAEPERVEPDPRRAWPVPQPPPEPEMPVYMPPKTMPELPMVYSSGQQLRDAPKKGFELTQPQPSAPHLPPQPPDTPHIESTTKKKVLAEKQVSEAHPPAAGSAPQPAVHQHFTADEHDGLSEHPPAAVLLLVLGILMTTVMGAMLGCRARAARRRLRRGKSPFAHDADYLVNGMYL